MNHLEHIAAHLDGLDAILLTSEANCYYATGFMGEGIALVTRRGSWYFTDSRYTEAADKAIGDAAVIREVSREKPFSALINEALAEAGAEKAGFEALFVRPRNVTDIISADNEKGDVALKNANLCT